MTRFISFLFLCIYLMSQAASALPAFNGIMHTYTFKKKCKLGRKETLLKYKSTSGFKSHFFDHQKSVKKIIPYCLADVHINSTLHFDFFKFNYTTKNGVYSISKYACFTTINAPPPLII